MTEKDIDIVLTKLDGLEKFFEERFRQNTRSHEAMCAHLEKLNGKVAKHNEWLNENHKLVEIEVPENTKMRNGMKAYLMYATLLGGSVGGIVGTGAKTLALLILSQFGISF